MELVSLFKYLLILHVYGGLITAGGNLMVELPTNVNFSLAMGCKFYRQFPTSNLYICEDGNWNLIRQFISFLSGKVYTIRMHRLYDRKHQYYDQRIRKENFSIKKMFDDPLFSRQWYLLNRDTKGHDLNVLPVWKRNIKGKGVVISLIDDGLDFEHKDLRDSYRADLSYDFNTGKSLHLPSQGDHHGTRCAGQLVSKPNNSICGVGIAPEAQVSGIRILSMSVASHNEASAVTHKYDKNHIYSCSWGPADDGKAIDSPDPLVLKSFIDGLINGRGGKGSIYVFAAGNGKSVDNCNYDGYANGIFSLTVGAIDCDHEMPIYMEPCSAQIVTAYSSNSEKKIATTDPGSNRCTMKHGGTSAAAPMVAGIIALALSIRPDLTWRDIKHLCVETATPIKLQDSSWVENSSGKLYSYKFGFGKIDADKFVTKAESWKPIKQMTVRALPKRVLNQSFNSSHPLIDEMEIDERVISIGKLKDIELLEQVTVNFNLKHSFRGDITISLISPSGTKVILATRRPLDNSKDGLVNWSMMTYGFWGESIQGIWKLVINNQPKSHGNLIDYRISFWGTLKDEIQESKETFAELAHRNYYLPEESYFDDVHGVWNNTLSADHDTIIFKEEESLKMTISLVFSISLLIIFVIIILVRLIRGRKRRAQDFLPINTSVIDLQALPSDSFIT